MPSAHSGMHSEIATSWGFRAGSQARMVPVREQLASQFQILGISKSGLAPVGPGTDLEMDGGMKRAQVE